MPPASVEKMLMSWVRPGVFDTRASCFCRASALMSDDFPTFERPTKATSAGESGSWSARLADDRKRSLQRSAGHGGECMEPFAAG